MESKHLGAEEVLSAGKTSGELELVGHVGCLHDLIGPLAVNLIQLVDLEPASANTSSLRCVIDGTVQEVGDGTGVAGGVPLDLDGVALSGLDGLNARRYFTAVDIAGHVVRLYVCDGAVRWRHPDTDLVARCFVVDPELMEVLVGRDGGDEGSCDDSLGEHLEGWPDW